jgi:hypothetical protein
VYSSKHACEPRAGWFRAGQDQKVPRDQAVYPPHTPIELLGGQPTFNARLISDQQFVNGMTRVRVLQFIWLLCDHSTLTACTFPRCATYTITMSIECARDRIRHRHTFAINIAPNTHTHTSCTLAKKDIKKSFSDSDAGWSGRLFDVMLEGLVAVWRRMRGKSAPLTSENGTLCAPRPPTPRRGQQSDLRATTAHCALYTSKTHVLIGSSVWREEKTVVRGGSEEGGEACRCAPNRMRGRSERMSSECAHSVANSQPHRQGSTQECTPHQRQTINLTTYTAVCSYVSRTRGGAGGTGVHSEMHVCVCTEKSMFCGLSVRSARADGSHGSAAIRLPTLSPRKTNQVACIWELGQTHLGWESDVFHYETVCAGVSVLLWLKSLSAP